jgi:DNA-directed RNA polymerase specialized sigma24 family protein
MKNRAANSQSSYRPHQFGWVDYPAVVTDTPDWAHDTELLRRWRAGDNRAGSEIHEGVTLRAFVLAIARHKMIDHLRKLSGGRHEADELGSIAALAPGASTIISQRSAIHRPVVKTPERARGLGYALGQCVLRTAQR